MIESYSEIGTEGHDLNKYRDLFDHAKEYKEFIKLHAGFIPRTYAKLVMREGEQGALKTARENDYVS